MTGDWRLEPPSVTSTEHQAPSAGVDRSFIGGEAHPPMPNANGTGWANQLTCSLAQLSRSTRGCASTKVKGQRSVKGGMERNIG